jgi:hypothetical protein
MHLQIIDESLHANNAWPSQHAGVVFPLSDPALLEQLVAHVDRWFDIVGQLVLIAEQANMDETSNEKGV